MTSHIVADTISEAWLSSLALFRDHDELNRFESDRGPCVERENVLISVTHPAAEPRIADAYPKVFRPLVDGVSAAFRGESSSQHSTLQERLYEWPRRRPGRGRSSASLDQFELVRKRIRESPESRFTLIGFWDPDIDPFLANPVSPLQAAFRVRNGVLNASLSVRSVDAWMGGFPMFVGFADLHEKLAEAGRYKVGSSAYFVLSYHVYEIDLPMVMELIA